MAKGFRGGLCRSRAMPETTAESGVFLKLPVESSGVDSTLSLDLSAPPEHRKPRVFCDLVLSVITLLSNPEIKLAPNYLIIKMHFLPRGGRRVRVRYGQRIGYGE